MRAIGPRAEAVADTIAIRDTNDGLGVAPTERDAIFRPFVTTRPIGSGVGLALARQVLRQHGEDPVIDPPAIGTSFVGTVPFPRGSPEAAAGHPLERAGEPARDPAAVEPARLRDHRLAIDAAPIERRGIKGDVIAQRREAR